jgi:hypothetical protein
MTYYTKYGSAHVIRLCRVNVRSGVLHSLDSVHQGPQRLDRFVAEFDLWVASNELCMQTCEQTGHTLFQVLFCLFETCGVVVLNAAPRLFWCSSRGTYHLVDVIQNVQKSVWATSAVVMEDTMTAKVGRGVCVVGCSAYHWQRSAVLSLTSLTLPHLFS